MLRLLLWLGAIVAFSAGPSAGGSILITTEFDAGHTPVKTRFTGRLWPAPDNAQFVRWNFGDGSCVEGIVYGGIELSIVDHAYTYPGTYQVTARMNNTAAGEWVGQKSVTLNGSISVTPGVGVAGHAMNITADFLPPPRHETRLYWALGNGSTHSHTVPAGTASFILEHNYNSPGDYGLVVEAEDLSTGAAWFGSADIRVHGSINISPTKGIAEYWTRVNATISPPAHHEMQLYWILGDSSTCTAIVPAGTSSHILELLYVLPGNFY